MLGVSVSTIKDYCSRGRIRGAYKTHYPHGDVWEIPERSLLGFERPRRGRPPEKRTTRRIKPTKENA